ncbi:MAG: hypothetical protein KGL25_11755 [Gammaproteobacteria bacterium]|nr:hypothetical protein [Gammaproteobacteria bacterium]
MRRAFATMLTAALLTLAGCATERMQREGLRAVDAGEYEPGLGKLERAAHADPRNLSYRLDLRTQRDQAVHELLAAADRARADERFDAAEQAYRRVLGIDASNNRALAGLEQLKADRRHMTVIAQARKDIEQNRFDDAEAALRAVLRENPGSASASALRARIDAARAPLAVTPRLQARDNRPVTLQFRDAPTKMVFEVLSRQTGINFIFDKDVKTDTKTTIFVERAPIEQAIGLILAQGQLSQQVLAPNMALIYPNTEAKQKDYRDQVVRTFYVTNTDPKRVQEALKTVLGVKTSFIDERANLVIIRDTPDAIRMAERLIASIDVAEAEVMLEVEVLEITRNRLQQLGVNYPGGVTLTPTPLAGEPLVLADLKDQDETTIKVSDLAVSVDLKKSVGQSNVLASPRIRARNREKAKVLIGNRVPVITNSVTPTNGGVIANGSVQYLDVGLTLEVEPTVRMNGNVAIKVNLVVSSIVKEVSVPTGSGGVTLAYQIGTREANTLLEVHDGETQVLAGLINDSDRMSSSHVPGLGDLPLIGRLFGSRNNDREKSEIVLSLTPRIVRAQARAAAENLEFRYGTENELRSRPLGVNASVPASAAGRPTGRGTTIELLDTVEQPLVAPTGATRAQAGPAPGADAGSGAAAAAAPSPPGTSAPAAAATSSRPALILDGEPEVAVGEDFTVTLNIAHADAVSGMRAMLRYDPSVLQFTGGSAGGLIPEEQRTAAVPRSDVGGGRVRFELSGTNVTGDGTLVTLNFHALAPRPQTMITLQQFAASSGSEALAVVAPRPLVMAVTP